MKVCMKVLGSAMLMAAAVAWTAGCGGGDSDDGSASGGTNDTNTVTNTTDNATNDTDGAIVSIPVGKQVPGGSAVDNVGLEHLTPALYTAIQGYPRRYEIMVHSNQKNVAGGTSDGYCAELALEAHAIQSEPNPNGDGSVIWTCRDFVSPRGSGLVWKFMGYRLRRSSTPIITTNPYVLKPADQVDTFHVLWNSYLPAE